MPWSGGNFTRANGNNGWVTDATNGIGIEAGRHDTQDNDFKDGINECLNKDGSNAATGNLNFGNFRPTNINAGTAAAPAICAGNDVNTGVFGPAADTWAVATNGAERVRIDSTGRVGIGTTAPTSALQVTGAIDGSPDAEGVHIGMVGTAYACVELCGSTGGIIDFTSAGVDNKGRILYTNSDNAMAFNANGAERMRITSAGRVGIGTTPGHYFVAANSESNAIATALFQSNVSGDVSTHGLLVTKYDNNSTTSQRLVGFFINQGAAGQGQINANGASQAAFGSFSDIRMKENITDLPSQLGNMMALRPVEFDYKDGSGHQIGFIAQEVQEIYPDLIGEGNDGFLTLSGLGKNEARMIKAFQEFAESTQATISALEARVAALEEA
jgi:hypothetical protein